MYRVFSARVIKLNISLPLSFCRLCQNLNCLARTIANTDGCRVSRNTMAVAVLNRTSSAIFKPLLYSDIIFFGKQFPHILQLLRMTLQKHAWNTINLI